MKDELQDYIDAEESLDDALQAYEEAKQAWLQANAIWEVGDTVTLENGDKGVIEGVVEQSLHKIAYAFRRRTSRGLSKATRMITEEDVKK